LRFGDGQEHGCVLLDFQSDAYLYRYCRIAAVPDAGWPIGRAAACLPDCCVAATASRRGEGDAARAKGQGAAPSEREGRRAGEGDEPTKETSKRA
jgi:hypothetical protein